MTNPQRTNRNIRLNDEEWKAFKVLLGAEWLRGQIDRAIKRHLGKIRFYVPPQVQQVLQAQGAPPPPPAPPTPTTRPTSSGSTITMSRNEHGVYEVENAR